MSTSPDRPRPVPSPEVIREFNDRGTLWLLEDPANLQDVLRILEPSLAERLDFRRATRVNRSFVPADLEKQEGDLLFRVPYRRARTGARAVWVYVLLEHQSRRDPEMALRLLLYMAQLWDTQHREWQDARAPARARRLLPVVPIVFYTGREAWKPPLRLAGLMDLPEEIESFVPRWETLFLNLHGTRRRRP